MSKQNLISKLSYLFNYIENLPIGWVGIFLIAAIIISARIILESVFDAATIFSYWTLIFLGSWFFSLFISFIIVISFFAKISPVKSARLLIVGLPVILLPLLGLIFGVSRYFDFLTGDWHEIGFHLITFVVFHPQLGIFFAVEILTVLAAFFIFFLMRVGFSRAIFGVAVAHLVLAFFAIQAKILEDTWVSGFFSTDLPLVPVYAAFNFALLILAGAFLFYRISSAKARALFFQVRPERLISLAIFMGLYFLGARESGSFYFFNFMFGFGLFCLFLFYAALSNDAADLAIDKISNPNRPYAKGILTAKEMKIFQGIILGIIAILVLIIDSMPILILTLVNIGLSIFYSVFRFRKYLFSHLIAALGESTVVLYGYFVQAPASSSAPMEAWILFFAVFGFFALFLPVKDLKDFAGDKKEKVRNFLTVFGWERGKVITAVSVFFAYIIFAIFLGGPLFFAISFIFAGLGAYFVVYYERIGERASYVNFLAFVLLFILTH